jgi:putative Mg2+ transporter-C (MgtC) family protein
MPVLPGGPLFPELSVGSHFLNDFLVKSGAAILCGGLIGIERELKKKPAGFRTNILICLGSTYFMMVSILVGASGMGKTGDPGRIAAQVVTGIGFIGAGTIIQSRGHIAGLTTAALIWVVASVGLFIGAGYMIPAAVGTLLIFLTLTVLGMGERKILSRCRTFDCLVVFADDGGKTRKQITRLLASYEKSLENLQFKTTNGSITLTLQYCDSHAEHRKLLSDLWMIEGVQEVRPLR